MTISLDVWSDIACPWCYIGKRRLEAALRQLREAPEHDVVVRWRAFELDANAPRSVDPGLTYAERLARKYGTTIARGEEMIRTMTAAGAEDGLDLRFDRIRPGNTFDAHRLVRFGAARGRAAEVEERFFRAYLTEGVAIGEPEELARLAHELGFEPREVADLLAGDAFADDVREDEREAHERGIHGVPYFLIAGRHGLGGAQPPDVLLGALRGARP